MDSDLLQSMLNEKTNFYLEVSLILKSSTGNYHSEMNLENHGKWSNLPKISVTVVDNMPYHNIVQTNLALSPNSKKTGMVKWLNGRSNLKS